MKRPFLSRLLSLSALTALLACSLSANTAIEPVPRDEKWVGRHDGFVQIAKAGGVDVLFVGDSITDGWRTKGKLLWDGHFAPLKAANFGIGGDRTQHVLWRLKNGELDGISPKVVVLMIGTNNTGFERDKSPRNTETETIAGVTAVVKELRAKLPSSKILLLAVFPRGDKDSVSRKQVNAVNEGIAKLHDGKAVTYLDINQRFLYPDGTLPKEIMPDLLHPNEVGYAIWADAIKEPLAALLKP